MANIIEELKAERVQFYLEQLVGWAPTIEWNAKTRQEETTGIWTAFELADHLEGCELTYELGVLADIAGSTPDLDVRGNIVFVTLGGSFSEGMSIEDFDFAKAVDREIGAFQRTNSLRDW